MSGHPLLSPWIFLAPIKGGGGSRLSLINTLS